MARDFLDGDRLTPLRIALIYVVFGLLALVVSDVVLPEALDQPLLDQVQTVKGAVEVFLTAGLIYLLVSWSVRGLRLRQRAIDAAPIGVAISDPDREDNPLIFVNDRFEALTGYDETDVLGRNCRFLQGRETDPGTRAQMREAIEAGRAVSVDVVNYRDNGAKFWNKVDIAPVRDADGEVTNFVGFQADITERKIREERLRVLNRVLRHNFRNKMTVIGGHTEMLAEGFDEPPESLDMIQSAVADLQSLTETVRKSESVLQAAAESHGVVALDEHLRMLVHGFRERYPAATFDLEVPEETVRVEGAGIVRAVEEAVDNAVRHNEAPHPTVAVRVELADDGWVAIAVADDGPGIPDAEIEVLAEGETPLKHGNRLGIWSIHWIVNLAGGTMSIEDSELGGSRLTMSVPSADA